MKDLEKEGLVILKDDGLEGNVDEFENVEDVEKRVDEPAFGMSFDSSDEMFTYYKAYGKQKGFPVKRRTSKKGSDGILSYVTFACGKSGTSRSNPSNFSRSQTNAKTGCNAKVGGCRDEDGKWQVRTLILEHNHGLNPGKSMYFRCNRNSSSHVKRQLETNDRAGKKVAKNFNSFVVEAAEHDDVSFLESDHGNYINKIRRLQLGEEDAIAIQRYFLKMQAKYEGFFFSMDLDEEGQLKNVFWADPRSRAAYNDFGDIIYFDTTYLTNNYDLPFVPFIGVNHHGQSILLGCGLVSCEDIETFTWLFRTWLSCMSGSAPIGIITDQDKALKKAIEIVFPNTRHRWCLWHIFKKVPEKLGFYQHDYHAITYLLHCAVYDSQSPAVFEETWNVMIMKYDLANDEWLSELFDERHRWVPCFVKSSFWAGISVTQRNESVDVVFDGYVDSKTTWKQFVEQYGNVLRSQVEREYQADVKSFYPPLPRVTAFKMEEQILEVYTMSKFQEFQQELFGKLYCFILKFVGSEYEVGEHVNIEGKGKRITFKVLFEKDDCVVSCSCSRFQFRGILCRHAIQVLIRNDIFLLPEKYILRRWRKDVQRCHSRVKINYDVWNSTTEQVRYEKMCDAFAEVADMAADDVGSYKLVLEWIENVKKELPKKTDCGGSQPTTTGQGSCSNNVGSTTNEAESMHDQVPI